MNSTQETTATHEDMSSYIVDIHGRPYMTVAGRVVLMHKEADKQGDDISIDTELAEFQGTFFCVAKVRVGKKQATARASVNVGAKTGVDATNAFENAETSAVGRALGFLGYGDVTGIASADEVVDAHNRQNGQRTTPI